MAANAAMPKGGGRERGLCMGRAAAEEKLLRCSRIRDIWAIVESKLDFVTETEPPVRWR